MRLDVVLVRAVVVVVVVVSWWEEEVGGWRERVKVYAFEFEVAGMEMSDQRSRGLKWRTWIGFEASWRDPTEKGSPG